MDYKLLSIAEGRYNVATENCGTYPDLDKTACLSRVDVTYAVAKALAIADRDAASMQADYPG